MYVCMYVSMFDLNMNVCMDAFRFGFCKNVCLIYVCMFQVDFYVFAFAYAYAYVFVYMYQCVYMSALIDT